MKNKGILIRIVCVVCAMSLCMALCSCGSKKEKARAQLTNSVDESQTTVEAAGFGNDDDVFADDTTVATSADEVTYLTKHSYEFYEYQNSSYNMVVDYQIYLSKSKYINDFKSLKSHLDSIYENGNKYGELQYAVQIASDKSRKYVDGNGKTVTDNTITNFFKNHDRIGSILYYKTGDSVSLYIEYIQPTLVVDFNYTIHMYAIYNDTANAMDIKNNSDTREFEKIAENWYYYVQQIDSVRYKIVN